MPCGRCDSLLISIKGRLACPRCERVRLVRQDAAAKTLGALARRAERELVYRMSEYDRNSILEAVFKKREQIARKSRFDRKLMDARTVLGCSAAIKKLAATKSGFGNRPADPALLLHLSQKLGNLLFRLEKVLDLEARTYNLLYMKKYSLSSLVSADPDDFPLYPNERHVQAFVARADLGMMTLSQAKQWAPPPDGGSRTALGPTKMLTVEDAVRDYYDRSYALADAFFGTPVRKKYGAPPRLDQLKIPLFYLQKFASLLPYDEEGIAVCCADRFGALAREVFGGECQIFEDSLVMSGGNTGAFPLFLKIGDKVHASESFGKFYMCALLNVVHKSEFDQETQRRGEKYESEVVPAHFMKKGFTYYANVCVKNKFEIDGIAVSSGAAYVIEAKYWNPRKFLGGAGRYGAHDDMVRGSIEGTRLDRATGKWERRGAALADKAEWVEKNRACYGIPAGTPVKRALVTNTHPVAREYKGCEIIRVEYVDAPGAQGATGGPVSRAPAASPADRAGPGSPGPRSACGRPGGRRK